MVIFGPKINTFELFSKSFHKIFSKIVPDDRHFKVATGDCLGCLRKVLIMPKMR